jgi:hypothetical protein
MMKNTMALSAFGLVAQGSGLLCGNTDLFSNQPSRALSTYKALDQVPPRLRCRVLQCGPVRILLSVASVRTPGPYLE